MKAYQFNDNIDALEIDPSLLKEGLDYAKSKKLKSVRILPINQNAGKTYKITLDILGDHTYIQELRVPDSFKFGKGSDINGIYLLKNLSYLSFDDPIFKLDFSKLPGLTKLFFKYNSGIKNLKALTKVEELKITSLTTPDLNYLSGVSTLKALYLAKGSFQSLKGIKTLGKLETLNVAYCPKLTDGSEISSLSHLSKLAIEKCTALTDFSFLKNNKQIRNLFIDNLDSISFVNSMANLEAINFWDNKDGDMTPLLKSKSLKQINFYPNKKHYSHTIEEIIAETGARRGVNK